MKKNNKFGAVLSILGAFFLCTLIFSILYLNAGGEYGIQDATYMEFKRMANNGEIEEAYIDPAETTFEFKTKDGKTYVAENPDYDTFKLDMLESGIQVKEVQPINTQSMISMLINLVFVGIMIYFLSSLMKQQSGNMSKKLIRPEKDEKEEINIGTNGKKKVNKRRTTFQDVAGLKQVKNDMMLLVDFLKNPNQYTEAGAKLPKGVIFYGPPGTGKTLLAKALAGEAGVPFFNMSGSDFIEMFVGLGAKRVRELFEEARKNAPCIIFIDELDAIGNSRSNLSSGNTEHRQTINALLAEMDGFNGAEGILVIGATNRLEDLDNALIRPGRFDKHISVPLPETADERLEIINLYTKNKKFAEDVNFELLAKETIGFSPADIEALLNEAVLISVQDKKRFVDRHCIDEAIYKKLLKGHAKDDMKRDEDEIKLVAWHEAGHATLGKLLGMDVSKVTIIPSTSGAGGVNIIVPKKMGLYSIDELKDNVRMSYGGRCAEYMLYGDWNKTTTGASADIQQATSTIKNMISTYGMSNDYGMLNLNELNVDSKVILNEAIKMSKKLMNEALEMLEEHRDMHQAIVDVLLEKETISGEELDEIYQKYVTEKKAETDKIDDNSSDENIDETKNLEEISMFQVSDELENKETALPIEELTVSDNNSKITQEIICSYNENDSSSETLVNDYDSNNKDGLLEISIDKKISLKKEFHQNSETSNINESTSNEETNKVDEIPVEDIIEQLSENEKQQDINNESKKEETISNTNETVQTKNNSNNRQRNRNKNRNRNKKNTQQK